MSEMSVPSLHSPTYPHTIPAARSLERLSPGCAVSRDNCTETKCHRTNVFWVPELSQVPAWYVEGWNSFSMTRCQPLKAVAWLWSEG